MVLDLDGQPLVGRVHRGSLRDRPRAQHPVDLQAEVVVQRAGVVLLDDEAHRLRIASRRLPSPAVSVGVPMRQPLQPRTVCASGRNEAE
jgi:hypothetical protein